MTTTNETTEQQAGSGAGGVSQTNNQSGAGGTTNTTPWYSSLSSAELKDSPSLRKFQDVEGLAKSYVSLEKTLGAKNTVTVPDQFATDDDWKAFYQKTAGLPESVDKYEIKGEGYDPAFLGEFKKLALEANVTPKQAQKLADWYAQKQKAGTDAQNTATGLAVSQAVDGLKKEYGQAFESTKAKAKAAVAHYGDKDMVAFLNTKTVDGVPLTDHPVMFKLFAKLANDTMKEGQFKGETFFGNTLSPKQAMVKANQIIGDINHPYHVKKHPGHSAAMDEVKELFALANSQ